MACALFQGVFGACRRAWRDWGRLKGPGVAWRMTGITDAAGVKTLTREASPAIPARDTDWWRTLARAACEAEAAAARERDAGEAGDHDACADVRAGVAALTGDASDGSGGRASERGSMRRGGTGSRRRAPGVGGSPSVARARRTDPPQLPFARAPQSTLSYPKSSQ